MDSILQSGRGRITHKTKLSTQELELKVQAGLCVREAGFYGNTTIGILELLLNLQSVHPSEAEASG